MKKADKLSEAEYEFADLKPGDSCIISNRTDYVMSLLRGGMNDGKNKKASYSFIDAVKFDSGSADCRGINALYNGTAV